MTCFIAAPRSASARSFASMARQASADVAFSRSLARAIISACSWRSLRDWRSSSIVFARSFGRPGVVFPHCVFCVCLRVTALVLQSASRGVASFSVLRFGSVLVRLCGDITRTARQIGKFAKNEKRVSAINTLETKKHHLSGMCPLFGTDKWHKYKTGELAQV